MWLLLFFLEKLAAATLNFQTALSSESCKQLTVGAAISYSKMINCLQEMYVTDDFIIEMNAKILLFTEPSNMMPTEYEGALWNKARRCHCVYNE